VCQLIVSSYEPEAAHRCQTSNWKPPSPDTFFELNPNLMRPPGCTSVYQSFDATSMAWLRSRPDLVIHDYSPCISGGGRGNHNARLAVVSEKGVNAITGPQISSRQPRRAYDYVAHGGNSGTVRYLDCAAGRFLHERRADTLASAVAPDSRASERCARLTGRPRGPRRRGSFRVVVCFCLAADLIKAVVK
jgi:hypothetical protein